MLRDFVKWRVPHLAKSRNTSPGGRQEKRPFQLSFAQLKTFLIPVSSRKVVAGIRDLVLRILNSRNICIFLYPLSLLPPPRLRGKSSLFGLFTLPLFCHHIAHAAFDSYSGS
jgi:hypothetical protein